MNPDKLEKLNLTLLNLRENPVIGEVKIPSHMKHSKDMDLTAFSAFGFESAYTVTSHYYARMTMKESLAATSANPHEIKRSIKYWEEKKDTSSKEYYHHMADIKVSKNKTHLDLLNLSHLKPSKQYTSYIQNRYLINGLRFKITRRNIDLRHWEEKFKKFNDLKFSDYIEIVQKDLAALIEKRNTCYREIMMYEINHDIYKISDDSKSKLSSLKIGSKEYINMIDRLSANRLKTEIDHMDHMIAAAKKDLSLYKAESILPVGLSEIEMIKAKQKAKAALTDEDKRRKKIHDKARHSVSIISTKLEELSKHLIALSV